MQSLVRFSSILLKASLITPIGAFVAGIIVPREGGLAISITEKLEDMVSIIFLPLVSFTLHLSTDGSLTTHISVLYAFWSFNGSWTAR